MTVIDEPHDAVAASRCLTARSLDTGRGAITAQHPRPCTWCATPLPDLNRLIEGWNQWVDPKDRGRSTVYERHEARVFVEWARKHPAEAEALIVSAQGLEALPEPDPVAESVTPPPPSLTRPPFPRASQVSTGRSDRQGGGTHRDAALPAEPSASISLRDGPEPVFSDGPSTHAMAPADSPPAHEPAIVEEDVTAWT